MLAIKLIVGAFVFALIAAPMWLVFDAVLSPIESETVNTTAMDTTSKGYAQGIYSLIRNVITTCFVICLIGGFIAYIVERAAQQERYGGGWRG